MKQVRRAILPAIFIAVLTGLGSAAKAEIAQLPPKFVVTLEPEMPMAKGAPITLRLSYEVDSAAICQIAGTGAYSLIFINPRDFGDTLNLITNQFTHDFTVPYSTAIQVVLPDIDTCQLHLALSSGSCHMTYLYYFVSTGEEIELVQNFQMPMPAEYQQLWAGHQDDRHSDPVRDTLTQEHLQTEYEVIIDLRDSSHYEIVKGIYGAIPDSCLYKGRRGLYRIRTTLENLIKFGDYNLEFEFTTPPPWDPKYKSPGDSGQETRSDSESPQGYYPPPPFKFHATAPDGISLDSVDVIIPPDTLPTGTPITFYIHVKNTATPRRAITNSFRIFSGDGASWTNIDADLVGSGWSLWDQMFDMGGFNIDYRSADGISDDTVVFWGLSLFGEMPAYFDETSYSITIGPIDESMDGMELCLDSASFPPAGEWMWVDPEAVSSLPPWGGPYCFTIKRPSTINYSGHLYYIDPVPPDTNQMPMRLVTIQMWDNDSWPNPDDSLGFDFTTESGAFEFGPIENSDASGGLDIYFKIYAENSAAFVTELNGDPCVIQTPEQSDLPSGDYDTTIIASCCENNSESVPFFIANAALEGRDRWMDLTSLFPGPPPVEITLSDLKSYYNETTNMIYIMRDPGSPSNYFPDIWDEFVILHEYGHYLEYEYDFFDAYEGAYPLRDTTSLTSAASDGFAFFIYGTTYDTMIGINYYSNYLFWYTLNMEDGVLTETYDPEVQRLNNYGGKCLVSVVGALWDIYDEPIDDHSAPLPDTSDTSDGIGDSLWLGGQDIFDVLLNRYLGGNHPDSIHDFWDAWFQAPSKGHPQAMLDIWYEHGMEENICGDANADQAVDVGDATYIINYIFRGGPGPNPYESGDVNEDGQVNVGDAVYLITYIFKSGVAPCSYRMSL